MTTDAPITYEAAGVDINKADHFLNQAKRLILSTQNKYCLNGIGGFGGLFEIPPGYHQPVLVSGTDGVGTKLKLAQALNDHTGMGIDLVAMSANDVLTLGAKPLFFLDYYATGQLEPAVGERLLASIAKGCLEADMSLIGGETAEMPGCYPAGEYDLAGFCVGIVEKSRIIDGSSIQPGDQLIGLPSSGIHSNGFSLVRKVLRDQKISLESPLGDTTLGAHLLTPTRLYVKTILALLDHVPVKGMSHITGGGLVDNLPRILPPYTQAVLNTATWPTLPVFQWLKTQPLTLATLYRTFNMGIGYVMCVARESVNTVLKQVNTPAYLIGEVTEHSD